MIINLFFNGVYLVVWYLLNLLGKVENTYMTFSKYQIRFIDSYLFMVEPLKNLSDTYNIDTLKGYFPHHFNINENQNYIGEIPSAENFGVKNPTKICTLS